MSIKTNRLSNEESRRLPGYIPKTFDKHPEFEERRKAMDEKNKIAEQKKEEQRIALVKERNKVAKKIRGEK